MNVFRTFIMKLALYLDDLAGDIVTQADLDSSEETFGLALNDFAHWLFYKGYNGSYQEIDDALSFSEDEWPSSKMSDRQKHARHHAPRESYYYKSNGETQ